jgi:hypothetical protein
MDEDSLPDDWKYEKEVLVGMRPIIERNGIGQSLWPESHTG